MNAIKKEIECIIIDDEIEACDRLESLLKKIEGVTVIKKETDSERGIKKVIDLKPELVFADIEMPRKNGFEIVKEIRNQKVYPTFIFVTAYEQYAIKAIRNAAFDFLLKPVDIDELKETINRFTVKRIDKFINSKKENQKILFADKLKNQYSLTDREIEIVKLLLQGKSSKEIGEILFISKHTVNTHRRNILEKTSINSTGELVALLNNSI